MERPFPPKNDRESFETEGLIRHYKNLPHGRYFEVFEKDRECPDRILRDADDGSLFGVELTSVYLNGRSVPDRHLKPVPSGVEHIEYSSENVEQYKKRLLEKIQEKVKKARERYLLEYPLILSVYVNEYETLFMEQQEWEQFISQNESFFDNIAPFTEVVFWPTVNDIGFSVRPGKLS